jgi:hypothetical protein
VLFDISTAGFGVLLCNGLLQVHCKTLFLTVMHVFIAMEAF